MHSPRSQAPRRKLALLAALTAAMLTNTGCRLKPLLDLLSGLAGSVGGIAGSRGPVATPPKPEPKPAKDEGSADDAGDSRPRRVFPANESIVVVDTSTRK